MFSSIALSISDVVLVGADMIRLLPTSARIGAGGPTAGPGGGSPMNQVDARAISDWSHREEQDVAGSSPPVSACRIAYQLVLQLNSARDARLRRPAAVVDI